MNSIYKSINNFDKYSNVPSRLIKGDENILSSVDITIVMPIYNHHKYLKRAIESVIKQGTSRKVAILIVDNDSEQIYGNERVINSIDDKRIVYYRNDVNIGAAGNWNRCIELCKSKFFTYLHDDDMLKEDAVESLFEIKRLSNADFVFSCFDKVDEDGRLVTIDNEVLPAYRNICLEHMLIENYCHTGEAVLFDRELMLQLGGFSEEYKPCFDYALFTRIVYEFKAVKYLKPILSYRIAENDTLSCYKEIPIMDDFIRKCIIEKLNYPIKLMLKYNKVVLKNQIYMINYVFGGHNNEQYDCVNFFERILLSIMNRVIKYIASCKSRICFILPKDTTK